MRSKAEDYTAVRIDAYGFEEDHLTAFELYEEFSQRDINETITTRRDLFEKAEPETWESLRSEVDKEVTDFRGWLEENKKFEFDAAHYYSVSLKSLLLGLPVGVHVACLFDDVLSVLPTRGVQC